MGLHIGDTQAAAPRDFLRGPRHPCTESVADARCVGGTHRGFAVAGTDELAPADQLTNLGSGGDAGRLELAKQPVAARRSGTRLRLSHD